MYSSDESDGAGANEKPFAPKRSGTYGPTGALTADGGKYTVYTTDSGNGPVVESSYKRPAMPAKGLPN